jgi:hypothetical protein
LNRLVLVAAPEPVQALAQDYRIPMPAWQRSRHRKQKVWLPL